MQLEELKEIWKDYSAEQASRHRQSPEQIAKASAKVASSALAKIKNNMWMETVFSLLLAVFMAYTWNPDFPFALKVVALSVIVFSLATAAYLVYSIFWIDRNYNPTLDVKGSLANILATTTKAYEVSWYFNLVFSPVFFAAGFYYGFFMATENQETFDPLTLAFICVGITVLSMFALYPFVKYYMKKMYGRHLAELSSCYQDLCDTTG